MSKNQSPKKEESFSKRQKEMILDAHLLNKAIKDPDLIKAKIVDKQGRITDHGDSVARKIAAEKHEAVWQ